MNVSGRPVPLREKREDGLSHQPGRRGWEAGSWEKRDSEGRGALPGGWRIAGFALNRKRQDSVGELSGAGAPAKRTGGPGECAARVTCRNITCSLVMDSGQTQGWALENQAETTLLPPSPKEFRSELSLSPPCSRA